MIRKRGFTLVELSIVLVIIGLLIGGILAAQSMISTSKLQMTVKTIQQYEVMAQNFETKYNGQIPGDSTSFTPQGDGDGKVLSYYQMFSGNLAPMLKESFDFWHHLNEAGMLNTPYKGYDGFSTFAIGDFTGYVPSLNYGTKSFINAYTITSATGGGAPEWGNAWVISSINPSFVGDAPSLSGKEALALDSKIDDGLGASGNVQTLYTYSGPYQFGGGTGTGCSSGATGNPYIITDSVVCVLVLKANW